MNNKCKVVAIIPARSGSKSITNKNITELKDFPLFMYSYAAAKLSKKIDEIIFSTNNAIYKEIAESYGINVPFLRPQMYSTDLSSDREFLLHAMKWWENKFSYLPEYWVHLRPTTPLRDPVLIDQAIEKIINDNNATSLRSAHLAPESPLKWFKLNVNKKYFGSINELEQQKSLEDLNKPKELFEDIYIPNGYVDVVRASYMLNNEDIHGEKIMAFQTPVCTEVDTKEELDYLRFQIIKHGSSLYDYLNNDC